jgi:YHS domain-containing protein
MTLRTHNAPLFLKKSLAEFSLDLNGVTVFFCCRHCKEAFELSPEEYVGNLPADMVATISVVDTLNFTEVDSGDPESHVIPSSSKLASKLHTLAYRPIWSPLGTSRRIPFWPLIILPIPILVTVWGAKRLCQTFRRASDPGRIRVSVFDVSNVIWFCVAINLFLLLLSYRKVANRTSASGWQEQAFYHFGNPPMPIRMDRPPSLSQTYYRGNDELDDSLFNGGSYRTATFQASLRDPGGAELHYGDELESRKLVIRVTLERSPYTADVLFSDSIMGGIFLSRDCDAFSCRDSDDLVQLKALRPSWEWEAEFSIEISQDGESSDVIYMWEGLNRPQPMLHYAIQYEIHELDGKISEESDIWMGAIRVTDPVARFEVTYDQWWSDVPIPELLRPNTDDPIKLGIPEHLGRNQRGRGSF